MTVVEADGHFVEPFVIKKPLQLLRGDLFSSGEG